MVGLRQFLQKFHIQIIRHHRNLAHLSAHCPLPVNLCLLFRSALFLGFSGFFPLRFYTPERFFFHFLPFLGRADCRPLAFNLPLLPGVFFVFCFFSLSSFQLLFLQIRLSILQLFRCFTLGSRIQNPSGWLNIFNGLNVIQRPGHIRIIFLYVGRMRILLGNPGYFAGQLQGLSVLMELYHHIILYCRSGLFRRPAALLIVLCRASAVLFLDGPKLSLIFVPVFHQIHLIFI